MTILLRQRPLARVVMGIVTAANGAWFDPSDLSTLYQDAAGTIPVTAVEQPVGLMLDKSGNGYHATQSITAYRPALMQDIYGYYYLAFDGIDDYMTLGDLFDIGPNGISILSAVNPIAGGKWPIAGKSSADTTTGRYFLGTESTTFMFVYENGAVTRIPHTPNVGEKSVYSTRIGPHGARQLTLRKNGATISSVLTVLTQPSYNTDRPFWIGAYPNESVTTPAYGYFNGAIYGLIVTAKSLTDSQHISCERFEARKSGVLM